VSKPRSVKEDAHGKAFSTSLSPGKALTLLTYYRIIFCQKSRNGTWPNSHKPTTSRVDYRMCKARFINK